MLGELLVGNFRYNEIYLTTQVKLWEKVKIVHNYNICIIIYNNYLHRIIYKMNSRKRY